MKLHTEEIQKLKEERTETEAKIEQLRHQNERLKNRERYLTKRDRAARTHRLCVTGGIVESILPEIKTLTEAEQYELMEHILHLPDAQKMTARVFTDHARKERKAVDAVDAVPPVSKTRRTSTSESLMKKLPLWSNVSSICVWRDAALSRSPISSKRTRC